MQRLFFLILAGIVGVGVVTALYFFTVNHQRRKGSFLRFYPPSRLLFQMATPLDRPDYYLAGMSSCAIYLAHMRSPNEIRVINTRTGEQSILTFHLTDGTPIHEQLHISVDSPYCWLWNGSRSQVYRAELTDGIIRPVSFPQHYFQEAVVLPGNQIATRSLSLSGENILSLTSQGSTAVRYLPDVLEKQNEGIFSTDGRLFFDSASQRVLYIYFYRNQYLVMDIDGKLIYRARTIDTVQVAQLKFDTNRATNSISLSPQSLVINRLAAVGQGRLYIESVRMARNDPTDRFEKSVVLDVYAIDAPRYLYSFYLRKERYGRLHGFLTRQQQFVVLFEKSLVTYSIKF